MSIYFSRELGLQSYTLCLSLTCNAHKHFLAPSTAPMDISIDRTSPSIMVVSWTPLSYVEARGFISNYTVTYSPQTSGGRKRQALDTMFQIVPGMDSSTTTIDNLDQDTVYSVHVSATTGGGTSAMSEAVLAEPPGEYACIYACMQVTY